ncbi:hypothetical protein D8674_040884 [Pyrus ussuriensis x Pyrus communis]|uniref:Uncharacterized protein n=1 Tax=Pyrus ussuriensis x Pyrus communis TaxID=2448454 RepID=A0A5N5IAS9_9ROSA|nr:hypothetical protein D8674_040884 [Pyrus ussuriensis x Pyrus communis]
MKSNVGVNLEYLDLVEDIDRFNTYTWGERNVLKKVEDLMEEEEEVEDGCGAFGPRKDIFQRNVLKKVEELMEEVKALMREV